MLWMGYYNSTSLNPKWCINSDIQFRTKNEIKNYSQALVRSDISFNTHDRITISIGLAHFRYFINNEKTRGEWRPWQELKLTDKINNCKLIHRFRLEERFNQIVKNNDAIDIYQFNYRFRYRLDLRVPIIKEKEEGNNWYFIIGNEIMVNAGNMIVFNYFDQNRLFAGLNYGVNKKLSLQVQYMHIWQQASNGITLNSIEVIRLNIYHTISL